MAVTSGPRDRRRTSPPSAPSSRCPTASRAAVLAEAAGRPRRRRGGDGRVDATDVELVTHRPARCQGPRPGARHHPPRRRLPGALRDRRPRRGRRAGRRRSTPRCAAAARPSTCPTAPCRCTRPCSPRARPACCPDGPRPAVLWTIDLDAAGERTAVDVRRATVRSRARLDYAGCRPTSTPGRPHPPSRRCRSWARCAGPWRSRAARSSWSCPSRRSCPTARAAGPRGSGSGRRRGRGTRRCRCSRARRRRRSCWTRASGCCARCPAPEPSAVEQLRRTAATLGIAWPDGATAAQVLSGLPRDTAPALALRRAASTLLRGAGYAAFDRRRAPRRPQTPATAGSARRTRTSPRRCGGSWTGSAPRSASPSPRRSAAGVAGRRAALPARRSWRSPTRCAGKVERAASTAPRPRCWPSRVGAEFDAVVLRASGAGGASPARCSSPSRRCWRAAPGCRGRARWCGCGWSRRIRRPAASASSVRRRRGLNNVSAVTQPRTGAVPVRHRARARDPARRGVRRLHRPRVRRAAGRRRRPAPRRSRLPRPAGRRPGHQAQALVRRGLRAVRRPRAGSCAATPRASRCAPASTTGRGRRRRVGRRRRRCWTPSWGGAGSARAPSGSTRCAPTT